MARLGFAAGRTPRLSILCASAVLTSACASTRTSAVDLAITDVTVVDVESGELLADRTVLVRGDRIHGVLAPSDGEAWTAARVVDGTGRYLIPGLWDMHVHTCRGRRAEYFWPQFLAHGVTGVREMGGYLDVLQQYRSDAGRPGAVVPRIVWGAMYDGVPPVYPYAIRVPDAKTARAAVDDARRMDLDFVKVYDRLTREAYFALADAARGRGMHIAGHVPLSVTMMEASDAGQRSIEHVRDLLFASVPGGRDLLQVFRGPESTPEEVQNAQHQVMGAIVAHGPDLELLRPTLERLVANGTWLTATLTEVRGMVNPSAFDDDPRLQYVPTGLVEGWRADRMLTPEQEAQAGMRMIDACKQVVGFAHRVGVPILAGTDVSGLPYVFAGSGLHDQLELLVEAGLSPLDALRTATWNPAMYLEATDWLGSVRAERLADLVLLEADPLQDIGNTRRIVAVVANGRLIDDAERTRLLQEAARAAASIPIESESLTESPGPDQGSSRD